MKKILKTITVFLCVLSSSYTLAHSRWVVPSHSILSGQDPEYISVDISISNDIFHPDVATGGISYKNANAEKKANTSGPMLTVVQPDGKVDKSNPIVSVVRKSVSAVLLNQSGTYKIAFEQPPVILTLFKHANGDHGRIFGPLKMTQSRLPEGAKEIHEMEVHNGISTYVTRNDVTEESLKPTGKSLEVVFETHPNELFVGEKANFQLLFNGKPAAQGIGVRLTRQGTRYRNDRESIEVETGAAGKFSVDWEKSGLYLLEVEMTMDDTSHTPKANESQRQIVHAVYVTLEVSPE